MRKLFLLALLTVFSTAEAREWKFKFENKTSVAPTHYFEDIQKNTSQTAVVLREEPDASFRSGRDWKFRLAPLLWSDAATLSPSEKLILDANEANVEARFGDFTLRAGLNQIAWGATDFFNPLDVVGSRRYMDLLNSERRATPSLDVAWENEVWKLEGLYAPTQLESILPGENSRWLPRDMTYNRSGDFGRLLLADQFRYLMRERTVLDDALSNNFGFRVERRGNGVDLSAIFFQGAPTAPAVLTPVVDGTVIDLNPPQTVLAEEITLQPAYYTRRTAGAGAVITLETMIIRLAAANSDRVSKRSDLPGWSNSAVIGVEKNFSVGPGTLTSLLQATYAQHEEQAENSVTSLDRIFDRSWLLGARYSASTDSSVNLALLYDTVFRGWYGVARGEYKLTDGLTSNLQIDFLEGTPGSPLGTYRRNDRATVSLTYFL